MRICRVNPRGPGLRRLPDRPGPDLGLGQDQRRGGEGVDRDSGKARITFGCASSGRETGTRRPDRRRRRGPSTSHTLRCSSRRASRATTRGRPNSRSGCRSSRFMGHSQGRRSIPSPASVSLNAVEPDKGLDVLGEGKEIEGLDPGAATMRPGASRLSRSRVEAVAITGQVDEALGRGRGQGLEQRAVEALARGIDEDEVRPGRASRCDHRLRPRRPGPGRARRRAVPPGRAPGPRARRGPAR